MLLGEAGGFVDFQVTWQRHVAVANAVADVIQFSRGFLGIIVRPLGKIQHLACIGDMAVQPPRNRGNMPIPRPARFVRMTVVTGTPQHGGDLWRGRVGAAGQIVSGGDGGIAVAEIRELQERNRGQQKN